MDDYFDLHDAPSVHLHYYQGNLSIVYLNFFPRVQGDMSEPVNDEAANGFI